MAPAVDGLREQVLALAPTERARLASELLASLDDEVVDAGEVERLWSQETERRMAALDEGTARTFTRDEVAADLDRLRAERSD